MKRPLVLSAISFILGILIHDIVPDLILGLGISFLLSIVLILICRRLISFSSFIFLSVPMILLGFFLHMIQENRHENMFKPWADKMVLVTGSVFDEPLEADGKITFVLQVRCIEDEQGITELNGARIKVNVYTDKPLEGLAYGSVLIMRTKIEKPSGMRNIGGFDYSRFLAARGISGTANANPAQLRLLDGRDGFFLKEWGYGIRRGILDSLYGSMPEKEASLLSGMLIGYTRDMPESMEEAFRKAGLTHILAVSGANIAFLLFPLMWVLKRLGFSSKWASAITLPVMLFYVFATGMEASVIRAAIMAAVTLAGMILWRQTDIYCSMAFSVILILLSNTFMLFDAGFVLSYGATLSLVLFYKPVFAKLPHKWPKFIRDSLAGTFSAQLGTVPYIAASFNSFSAVSILANLIIVPVTGVVTVLGALLSISWHILRSLAQLLGILVTLLTDIILLATGALSRLPLAEIKVATPGFVLILGYFLILAFIRFGYGRLNRKTSRAILAVTVTVYGLMLLLSTLPSGRLELYFADVGQGDALVITTPEGKHILIDGGGSPMDEEKSYTGEQILVPLLYDLNAIKIDVMVASHGHADHINGLKSVIEHMRVEKLVVADAEDKEMNELTILAERKGIPVVRMGRGDVVYQEGDLCLTAVYPFKDKALLPPAEITSANELGLVTRLDYGAFSALFTGDIGFMTEERLAGLPDLDCDLIKIAHHGSKYSSGEAFIAEVSPSVAIISVGKNGYGHPAPEVEARLETIPLYKTIRDGGILITVDLAQESHVLVKTVVDGD